MEQLLRVHNFVVSADGFGSGQGQCLERPFGHVEPGDIFAWAGATASWPNRTYPGGTRGLDDYLTRDFHRNIGAEIMGRNKFGPQRGPWEDHTWRGWWGEEPPFHTPVFVMTHYPRPSFTLSETTFHFVDAEPAEVLRLAEEAADGKTSASAAEPRPSGASSTRTSSTPSTSRCPLSGSAAGRGCGTRRTIFSTGSTATRCRAPEAVSCTISTGAGDAPARAWREVRAPRTGWTARRRRRPPAGSG